MFIGFLSMQAYSQLHPHLKARVSCTTLFIQFYSKYGWLPPVFVFLVTGTLYTFLPPVCYVRPAMGLRLTELLSTFFTVQRSTSRWIHQSPSGRVCGLLLFWREDDVHTDYYKCGGISGTPCANPQEIILARWNICIRSAAFC